MCYVSSFFNPPNGLCNLYPGKFITRNIKKKYIKKKKTCTLSGMSLLQMDRPLHGFMLGDSQHVCGRKKQQKKHNSSTNALCMTPSRSLSTNTSPFENTKWANEMTAGKRKRKKCHKRGYVHVWARKKSFLHLILDQNYRNAEPLHRWHHISSPWFFF